jgi:hypothetical protein
MPCVLTGQRIHDDRGEVMTKPSYLQLHIYKGVVSAVGRALRDCFWVRTPEENQRLRHDADSGHGRNKVSPNDCACTAHELSKPQIKRLVCRFAVICIASLASVADCMAEPTEKCPGQFVERCRSEKAFKQANSADCLRLLSSKLPPDPAECRFAAERPASTCLPQPPGSKNSFPGSIQDFLKSCGVASCPQRMPDIKNEFGKIKGDLENELSQYGDILKLKTTDILDKTGLCKYTPEQITEYKKLANTDRSKLTQTTSRLTFLRNCSEHVVAFVFAAKRDNWTAELRDSLIRDANKDKDEAQREGGKAEESMKNLAAAPIKIGELGEIYDIACSSRR